MQILGITSACLATGMTSANAAAPLSIAEKLSDIMNSKEQIRQAIESHGVQVPVNTPLSQYSYKISQISRTPSNLLDICSAPNDMSRFPYAICGGYSFTEASQIFTASSCPTPTGTKNIYGNSRCSNQDDPGYGWKNNSNYKFRTVPWEPTNNRNEANAKHCWCQLCTTNSTPRTNCGPWAFHYTETSASMCSGYCAYNCGAYIGETPIVRALRLALCLMPA